MNSGSGMRKTKKSKLDTIFVMMVFMLFICCLLLVTLAFAKVYKNSSERINDRFENGTAVSFVLRNLQSFDKENSIAVKEMEGESVLCLYETIDGSEYVTYIYHKDGMLCELFADTEFPFISGNGEVMLPCESFDISIEGGTVSFTLSSGGKTTSQRYFLRSNAERTV
ncbi:MAG: DUF4860 domain-containing protein [Ruminococcaceae bacterium]|nr:DUF4860 domain-containing protein [Oscillospiraceae bacterium]